MCEDCDILEDDIAELNVKIRELESEYSDLETERDELKEALSDVYDRIYNLV